MIRLIVKEKFGFTLKNPFFTILIIGISISSSCTNAGVSKTKNIQP